MKIAVCVKQTPDTTASISIAGDGASIDEEGIQWIINPYDEFAIEEALQLAEKQGGEVTIITLGPARTEKTIREALAMGAHHAVRLHCEQVPDDPGVTAATLAEEIRAGGYDLVFTGRQAIDDDHAQMPSRLAEALDWPGVTMVVGLEVADGAAKAVREVEGGHERVSFSLPAVIGANRHLNEPRYRSMRGIMKAKRIPIDVKEAVLPEAKLVIEKQALPPQKNASRLFEGGSNDVPAVVQLLREEAQVL